MKAGIYQGKWDIEKIITHEYSLDQLAEAIEMAGTRNLCIVYVDDENHTVCQEILLTIPRMKNILKLVSLKLNSV